MKRFRKKLKDPREFPRNYVSYLSTLESSGAEVFRPLRRQRRYIDLCFSSSYYYFFFFFFFIYFFASSLLILRLSFFSETRTDSSSAVVSDFFRGFQVSFFLNITSDQHGVDDSDCTAVRHLKKCESCPEPKSRFHVEALPEILRSEVS